jgi:glycosyltransferase involved in cell wall biosynthesis
MTADIRTQGIKIISCVFDGSGYAQGIRNWISGMFFAGVPMWIQPISFEKDRPDLTTTLFDKDKPELGSTHDILDGLCRTPITYDINFIRLSPEVAVRFIEPGKINICSCAWETTLLDPHWVDCCNKFDAIFVESYWLTEVFKSSGVKVPIYLVPNCVDVRRFKAKEEVNKGTYTFYSIQQWTERKNGAGLLKAYFTAFDPRDDVQLVLKTYLTRVEEKQDQREVIKNHIETIKQSLNLLKGYPPVYLITEKLTNEAIDKMHEDCDCYVLLDRGEGLGLPYMDAAAAGNPIIATDFGGSRQFLNPENSYCVPYQMTFVDNMTWSPYYRGEQQWADPSLPTAAGFMRHVFENRDEAFAFGARARKDMETRFNSEMITKTLLGAIADVVAQRKNK